jgi:hypothetical protein
MAENIIKDNFRFNATLLESDDINCKRLWISVLEAALEDAKSTRKKFRDKRLKREAIDWLLHDPFDFHEICNLIGVDPQMIRNRLSETIGYINLVVSVDKNIIKAIN